VLDHIVIGVSDLAAAKAFYTQALAPLGIAPIMEFPGRLGMGADGKPEFWLREGGAPTQVHVAFGTDDRAVVDAFHAAALAAGATDNGGPGRREIYHPGYYGAFVLDPDGHNVEAVCHISQA
jgi:catechol 2,3-dioxygenase-like lactoylglutathione lyase family enzyme